MRQGIRIYAPATIANIGSGYDVMSLAIDQPGDIIEIIERQDHQLLIHNLCEEFPNMPLEADRNVTTHAMKILLNELRIDKGFDILFHQKIRPGSGLGSSAASACAGIFGLNELLGLKINENVLIKYASEGERLACGSPILDNVSACFRGGVLLIRSNDPLDIISLNYPKDLYIAIAHPYLEILTQKAREVVPKSIEIEVATRQWANTAGMVAGLAQSDFELIARSTEDHVVEPHRRNLIEGFSQVKETVLQHGGLNCSISGAGPALFSFCRNEEDAIHIANLMSEEFGKLGIKADPYHSKINSEGIKMVSE